MNHTGRNAAPGSKVLSIHRRRERTDAQPPGSCQLSVNGSRGIQKTGSLDQSLEDGEEQPIKISGATFQVGSRTESVPLVGTPGIP